MIETNDPRRMGDLVPQTKGEVQFDEGSDEGLVHDVPSPSGVGNDFRVTDGIAVEKNPVLRHFYVIENDDGVHFIKTAGQGIIKSIFLLRSTVPANEAQAGCSHRNRKGDRITAILTAQIGARVYEQFVGKRRQGGKHSGPSHNDRILRLIDLVQGYVALTLFGLRPGSVHLGIDNGMCQGQIVVSHVFVVI